MALPEMLGPLVVLHKAKEPLAVARKLVKDNACPLSVFTKALKDIEP